MSSKRTKNCVYKILRYLMFFNAPHRFVHITWNLFRKKKLRKKCSFVKKLKIGQSNDRSSLKTVA